MRCGVDRAIGTHVAALAICLSAAACGGATPEGAGRSVQLFYESMARGDFTATRGLTTAGVPLRRLEHRFGGFGPWATRATKNGTLMRAEVLDEKIEGGRAHVEVVVLFDDGTRRHDHLELVRAGAAWRIDPRSLPGSPRRIARAR